MKEITSKSEANQKQIQLPKQTTISSIKELLGNITRHIYLRDYRDKIYLALGKNEHSKKPEEHPEATPEILKEIGKKIYKKYRLFPPEETSEIYKALGLI